ncbi:MAG: helix-turn-helix domain-containing protein [Oscillospiraceae bacterium]|nr:helix-turn-helix domain-containing protein [Oscillospiraceae bacterium]
MKSTQELLKDLREDSDLNQLTVAELIGTTQQQYSKYETGESELPLRALAILADHYNVSTDFLMGRTDCREGITGQSMKVIGNTSAGEVISDILSLDASGRAFVIECISLRKLKETCTCTGKK